MKQCGIMGVIVFTTIANENLTDATQVENMFTDEVMYYVYSSFAANGSK